jgi:hypothetical protein
MIDNHKTAYDRKSSVRLTMELDSPVWMLMVHLRFTRLYNAATLIFVSIVKWTTITGKPLKHCQ